jgi:phosphoribosylanthranilate isomerase
MMVKICGITTREDAVASTEAGASALGFNFCRQSPRFIQPDKALEIGRGLSVLKVGIFVDESPARVAEIAKIAEIDIVQLHGSEDPAQFVPLRIWKAYRVTNGWSAETLNAATAEAFLLDGPAPGTGASFDWSVARSLNQRIILAGGLGPENVAEAIRQVRPWGVDACSRLESAPGIKDHERVRRFIRAAVTESL